MISNYPSIQTLGHKAIADLFNGPVIIQEKVDGSQVSASVINGELHLRSKKTEIDLNTTGMFVPAVETFRRLLDDDKLAPGWIYRGELISKPKHNTLKYNRVPTGYVILFDIDAALQDYLPPRNLKEAASQLGLESVPCFFEGEITDLDQLKSLLDTESILGGVKIEGIVIKNYNRWGVDGKALMGKWVREEFKEEHRRSWKPAGPGVLDKIEAIYKSPARWLKSVQHLRDEGQITFTPTDIGKLIVEIQKDLEEEAKGEISEILYDHHRREIMKRIIRGFPEFYKEHLAERQFDEPRENN